MIDREVYVFDHVYRDVSSLFAKGKFVSSYIESFTAYPAGALVELSNTTVRDRQSSSLVENYARIMYQFDGYATTKAKCREIAKAVDDSMIGLGFTRISGDWLLNANDPNIFRWTARYEADIDPDGVLYRRP